MRLGSRRSGATVLVLFGLAFGAVPASAAKKDLPSITDAEKAIIFRQGKLSAEAEACGLDWQGLSFRPMTAYWRRHGKTEEQMTLIGLYHGAAQGYAAGGLAHGMCTEAMRRRPGAASL